MTTISRISTMLLLCGVSSSLLGAHGRARAEEPRGASPPVEIPYSWSAIAMDSLPRPGHVSLAGTRRGHLAIWDWLAFSASMGAVMGIIEGECRDEGFVAGPVVGHVFLTALVGLFSGASWGGESSEPEWNPYVQRHPPSAANTFPELKRNLSAMELNRHPSVRVVEREGTVVEGNLVKVAGDSIVIRGPAGREVVHQDSIDRIDALGDPFWDGLVVGAAAGAGWALITANNCDEDPVTYVPRGRAAAIGAAVAGLTGLALDLLHDGHHVLYRRNGSAGATTLRVTPMVHDSGGGIRIALSF